MSTAIQTLIDGPAGPLEIAFQQPATAATALALICHPHPVHGGTMDNKVVQTLAKAFLELGYATMRFNFRGVGNSAGSFDEGIGETEDAAAALAWARLFYVSHDLWAAAACLSIAVLATVPAIVVAWRAQTWAGVLLLPYLGWLGVATSLAAGYAWRN